MPYLRPRHRRALTGGLLAAAALLAPASPALAAAPTASVSERVTYVATHKYKVSATVNANGEKTIAAIQYDDGSTSYAGDLQSIPASDSRTFSAEISSTVPAGQTIRYRAVALNDSGIVYSPWGTFAAGGKPTAIQDARPAFSSTGSASAYLKFSARVNGNGLPTSLSLIYVINDELKTANSSTVVQGNEATAAVLKSNLAPGTEMSYAFIAKNAAGSVWSPVYSYTAPRGRVRMMYLIPDDEDAKATYANGIPAAVREVQDFYLEQIGRSGTAQTFTAAERPVLCTLPRDSAYYHADETRNGQPYGAWQKLTEDVKGCYGFIENEQTDWIVYADVLGGCTPQTRTGAALPRFTLMDRGDLKGLTNAPDNYEPCPQAGQEPRLLDSRRDRWVGGLAHEFGHTVGLPHPPDELLQAEPCTDACQTARNSLMWVGYANFPDTYLTDAEIDKDLRNNTFFAPQS